MFINENLISVCTNKMEKKNQLNIAKNKEIERLFKEAKKIKPILNLTAEQMEELIEKQFK